MTNQRYMEASSLEVAGFRAEVAHLRGRAERAERIVRLAADFLSRYTLHHESFHAERASISRAIQAAGLDDPPKREERP